MSVQHQQQPKEVPPQNFWTTTNNAVKNLNEVPKLIKPKDLTRWMANMMTKHETVPLSTTAAYQAYIVKDGFP